MRINRNIVECKVIALITGLFSISVLIETLWNVKLNTLTTVFLADVSINRNIVECKVEMSFLPITFKRVLIETLWNVKEINLFVCCDFQIRINRNIVECKGLRQVYISLLDQLRY